jgi:hypothetical protein
MRLWLFRLLAAGESTNRSTANAVSTLRRGMRFQSAGMPCRRRHFSTAMRIYGVQVQTAMQLRLLLLILIQWGSSHCSFSK